LTAADIARLIGSPPTKSGDVGDQISPRSPHAGFYDQAFCSYRSPLASSATLDDQVAWLVGFLQPAKDRLAPVSGEVEVDVRLGFSSSSGQGGFALVADELLLLGQLGVQLNVDLYPPESDSD
jgi:hypothetical protein